MSLAPGIPGCQTQNYKYQTKAGRPSWVEMTKHQAAFKVIFKMDNDLTGSYHGMVKIPSQLECFVRFIDGEWVVSKSDDKFDFFSGCKRGGSGNVDSGDHYLCIYGLVQYELDWWRDSQGGMASRAHISNAGGSWLFAMQREMVKCSKV